MPAIVPDEPDGAAVETAAEHVVDTVDEHADEAEHGDRLELVRTGLVRLRIGETLWRLRRPFFGELKTLRLAWEQVNDELSDESIRAQAVAEQLIAERDRLNDDKAMTPDARAEGLLGIRRRDREAGRRLTDRGDELRIEWWTRAFDVLSVEHPEKVPPDFPAWMTSPSLPPRVIQHWRSVPLARG